MCANDAPSNGCAIGIVCNRPFQRLKPENIAILINCERATNLIWVADIMSLGKGCIAVFFPFPGTYKIPQNIRNAFGITFFGRPDDDFTHKKILCFAPRGLKPMAVAFFHFAGEIAQAGLKLTPDAGLAQFQRLQKQPGGQRSGRQGHHNAQPGPASRQGQKFH